MKHKAKLLGVKDGIITLKIDGILCSYLVQRPRPLSSVDVPLLRDVMDRKLLESLVVASGLVRPHRTLADWLGRKRHKEKIPMFGETVADYIEKIGVEVDIGKTKGVVLLKHYVDKIRKEDLG